MVNIEGIKLDQAVQQAQLKQELEAWALGFLIKPDQAFAANKLFLDIGSNGNTSIGYEPVEVVESRQLLNNRMGRDLVYSRTGLLLKESQAGVVDWPQLQRRNENLGSLGESLAAAGVSSAYAGGLARDQLFWRPGALMLADANGIIPWVYNNPSFRYHDVAPLIKTLSSGLTVVDLSLKDGQELGLLLQQLSSLVADNTTVILTFISEEEQEGNVFYPLFIKERDSSTNLVKSDSTRRLGLINSSDLHNYILNKVTGEGTALKMVNYQKARNWEVFAGLKHKMVWINTHRTQLCIVMGIVWFTHVFLIFWPRLSNFGLAGAVASPLLGIIWSTAWLEGMPAVYLSLLVFELVMWLVGSMIGSREQLISLVMIVFIMVLSTDQISGGYLSSLSVWGPDAIIGVRYYGLGNELLALALVATVWLLTRAKERQRWLVMAFALWVIVLVFSPRLGANFGAGLVLVSTSIYWLLSQKRLRLKWHDLLVVFAVAVLLLTLWSVTESVFFRQSNHISNAILNIASNHYGAVFAIVLNKLAIYQRVLGVSHGIELFFGMVLAGSFLFWAMAERLQLLVDQQQFDFYKTLIFGAVLALLVNDTGIVTVILVLLQVISIGASYWSRPEASLSLQYSRNMHNSL